ncbi:outer membrane protein transport protein [Vibrio sp. JC009]|uniref:OmpP1/FadL family transporter n=1 Tax=Vibrio sp. JC009 TaxID=2912314 RepID=UPI0023B080A7|nr:outer membrane protein transport protein [Vibrio sp. JC009]WED21028.1 outer membrane protein transport protein [Vibrio sp. JC009]
MKTNKTLLALTVAGSFLTFSATSNAAGFQLAEYSATGLGRAYAGEAAMADNAGAQWRNPAMLTYLDGIQVSAGGVYVDPDVDIEGTESTYGTTSSSDYASDGLIPNLYASYQINDQVTAGLAIGTNFAMETTLGDSFEASQYGDQAEITTSEANLNLGYKIDERFSIGGGIRYVMAEGKVGATGTTNVAGGQTLKYVEGDTTDWGWQLGAAWQINENHRIGFAYKSEVELKLEGTATGYGFFGDFTTSSTGYLPLTLPATAELASFHQLTEKLAVHGSINWTDWSSFERLEAYIDNDGVDGARLIKEENWDDNYRFALGATYQLNPKLKLRTGIAYDMEAVNDETRSITIPDTNRTWLSLGAGYDWSENLTLDLGMTYIIGEDATVTESDTTLGTSFTGTTSSTVTLFGAQASYKF